MKKFLLFTSLAAMVLFINPTKYQHAKAAEQAGAVSLSQKSGSIAIEQSGSKMICRKQKIKVIKQAGVKIKKVTYQIKNGKVATVSGKGMVTAKKQGSTKVTVSVRYQKGGKSAKKTMSYKIRVVDTRLYDKKDISYLKELIRGQKKTGAKVSANIVNEKQYTWKNGCLAGIDWSGKKLKGSNGELYLGTPANLTTLFVDGSFKRLDVSGCSSLKELYCGGEKLNQYEFSLCRQLVSLSLSGCANINNLDLRSCKSLRKLDIAGIKAENVDVSGMTELRQINARAASMQSINVKGCTILRDINLSGCRKLKQLDVSDCRILKNVNCAESGLTRLDASGCVGLQRLVCNDNQLTELAVAGCTALEYLNCENNKLANLDLTGCPQLRELYYDRETVELIGDYTTIINVINRKKQGSIIATL